VISCHGKHFHLAPLPCHLQYQKPRALDSPRHRITRLVLSGRHYAGERHESHPYWRHRKPRPSPAGAAAHGRGEQSGQLIKGGSSAWLKDTFPWARGFGWQDGYGAFTVSKSLVPEVENYIRNQREHHRMKTFEEEYRAVLEKHEIRFEERYLFDGEAAG